MEIEHKQEEVGPFLMKDVAGKKYQVTCTVKVMRELANEVWGPWIVESRQFKIGRRLVNPVQDGWFEISSNGTRLRPETKA